MFLGKRLQARRRVGVRDQSFFEPLLDGWKSLLYLMIRFNQSTCQCRNLEEYGAHVRIEKISSFLNVRIRTADSVIRGSRNFLWVPSIPLYVLVQ